MAKFKTARGNVEYDMESNFSEVYPEKGQIERTQVCQVDFADKDKFVRSILADVEIDENKNEFGVTQGTGETMALSPWGVNAANVAKAKRLKLKRLLPQPHPNCEWLYAVEARVIAGYGFPIRANDGTFQFAAFNGTSAYRYGKAQIEVKWRSLPYRADVTDPGPNQAGRSEFERFVSVKASYAGQSQDMGGQQFKYIDPETGAYAQGNPLIDFTFRRPMPEVHVALTWHMVPRLPHAAKRFMGLVNSEVIGNNDIRFRGGFKRGTLLYLTPELSDEYRTPTGKVVFDVTYHCLWRHHVANRFESEASPALGHNFILRPRDPAQIYWYRAGLRSGGSGAGSSGPIGDAPWHPWYSVHGYADLMHLFRIDDTTLTYG